MANVIDMIMAKANARMNEALERLKTKIVSLIPEDAAEDLGEIDISSFAKKALKGLEQDLKEMEENGIEESPKAKKSSPKKDPNAPKGAKNAYIIFCGDKRDQVKAENPEMNAKEIISEVARLWKETDEDVKAEYQEKATEDKKRYDKEMSNYVPSEVPSEESKEKKGKSPKKDPNAPKGAKNAYIIFCAENRDQVKADNPAMNAKEIISELARLWKEADEDVKAEYQEKSTKDKKRYQEEMNEYSSDEEAGSKKVEKKVEKKVAKGKSPKKDQNAPKGAKNAYIIFCADNRDQVKSDNPDMNAKEIISELARLWKEADEDMKAEYQEKAAEDKKRYQEEMSDYVPSDEEAETKVEKSEKVASPKKGSKKAEKSEKVASPKKGSKKAEVEEKVASPKKGSKKAEVEKSEKVASPKSGKKAGSKSEKTSKTKKSNE